MPESGQTFRFQVTIDHKVDLGNWSKCEGLTVEWEIQEYREGGLNDYVHRLPGRRKYQNIKLTRPLDHSLRECRRVDLQGGRVPRPAIPPRSPSSTARAMQVVVWDVVDVWPTRWTGPNMDVNGKDTAFETLELAHNGFTAD